MAVGLVGNRLPTLLWVSCGQVVGSSMLSMSCPQLIHGGVPVIHKSTAIFLNGRRYICTDQCLYRTLYGCFTAAALLPDPGEDILVGLVVELQFDLGRIPFIITALRIVAAIQFIHGSLLP